MGANISASNITSSSAYLYASWSGLLRPNGAVIMCNGQQVAGWWYEAGVENNCGGTISGLSPSTTYSANVTVWDEGAYGASASVTFTTLSAYVPPTVGTPTINNFTTNGLTLTASYSKGFNNNNVYGEIITSGGIVVWSGLVSSSPFSYTAPNYDTLYMIRMRGESGGDYSAWSGYRSTATGAEPPPTIVVGTPSIGSISLNTNSATTATIYYTAGSNNEFVEFEVKTTATEGASIVESFNASSSPISHQFPLENTTFYIRARGIYGGVYSTEWSNWTPFKSLTTGTILVVGVPTISSVSVDSELRVNVNFLKGNNNTEVEVEFSQLDGSFILKYSTMYDDFSTKLTAYKYSTTYRVRIRGNYNYGTKYSEWSPYTNFSTGSDPKGRPLNWSWSYNIASGQPVLKAETSADKKNIIAYIFNADEWTSFLERINAFRFYWDYKHGTHIGQIGFDNIGHNFEFTPSKMNDAINAINTMGYTIPTVSSVAYVSGGLANLLNYMKNCLNSIV